MTKQTIYISYLLRMWQTRDGETCTWRASLEQPGTRERQGFASLDEMFRFLQDQVACQPAQAHPGDMPEDLSG